MKIISVDIHASKNSNVYDGHLHSMDIPTLRAYLQNLRTGKEKTIVLLNAPITGYAEEFEGIPGFNPVTTRIIEAFFRNVGSGYGTSKVPGIQVTNYAGLTYWSVIQNLFQLDLSGREPREKFVPVFRRSAVSRKQINLVETHSQVALWMLQNDSVEWKMADMKTDLQQFIRAFDASLKFEIDPAVRNDLRRSRTRDEFMTVLGYLLCQLWLDKEADVTIVGNKYTGGFLVPLDGMVVEAFKFFNERKIYKHQIKGDAKLTEAQTKAHRTPLVDSSGMRAKRFPGRRRFGPHNVGVIPHAEHRAKQRLSWSRSAIWNMAQLAYREGFSFGEVPMDFRIWMKSKQEYGDKVSEMRLRGGYFYIFRNYLLVTLFSLPSKLKRRFEQNSGTWRQSTP